MWDADQPGRDPASDPLAYAALTDTTRRNVATGAWGLAAVYAVFTVMHATLLPAFEGIVLVSLTATSAALFAALGAHYRRRPPARPQAVAGMFAYIVLANVATHFIVMGELYHGYNFALYQLAVGSVILSRRWLVVLLTSTIATALTAGVIVIDDIDWAWTLGGLCGASSLAYFVHSVRVRTLLRLVSLKRDADEALAVAKQSEQELLRARHDLREIIENHPDGAIVLRNGVVVYANAPFTTLLRTGSDSPLVGKALVDLVARADRPTFEAMVANPGERREISFVRADNEHVVLELSPPRPIAFERAAATLIVARNVTERHADVHAKLVLADRMSAVGTLAAGVAHEINNPLAFIMMNLGILDATLSKPGEPSTPTKRGALIERISDSLMGADRIKSVVADLKGMSRVESVAPSIIDVRDSLAASVKMAANEIRHRCRLVERLHEVPAVRANAARLGQVFLNIIINGAHAIPEGSADANELTVATRTDHDGRAVIEISDTGAGMSAETKRRLFEPFYTTKPVGIGTGLGLYYCHNAIRDEGGELSFESELDAGSTFRVALPPAVMRSAAASAKHPVCATGRPKLRVLIIDDEVAIGSALGEVLTERGCDVAVATTGRDGIAKLREQSFDLVLCDLMIPDVPGPDIYTAAIADDPDVADRFAFITGGAFTTRSREFLDSIDRPVLHKPFDWSAIDELLDRAAARGIMPA